MATQASQQVQVPCSICGELTDWDEELGIAPLCVDCWDKWAGVDNKIAQQQKRYREARRQRMNT